MYLSEYGVTWVWMAYPGDNGEWVRDTFPLDEVAGDVLFMPMARTE